MSSGTCWHCEGDHDTGDCPTRKQWTKGEHQPGSPGVDLDELERAYANCDYDLIVDTWPALSRRIRELEAVACAAVVLADAGPGRTGGPMWTLLWTFLNDRVRRSLVPAMKRQGLPFTENDGEWRSEPPPGGAALVGISSAVRGEEQSRAVSLEAELRTLRARVGELDRTWQTEHALAATFALKAESAEARVKELETRLELREGHYQDLLDGYVQLNDERNARITDLESQLAAAREEQGLEVQLVALLTERNAEHSLQLRKHGVEPWMGVVRCRDGIERVFECDESEGLPALLRAILAVEKGGGPDEG